MQTSMILTHNVRRAGTLVVLMALAGCGGGGTSNPGSPCSDAIAAPPSLVSPASGTNKVPTSIGALTISNGFTGETVTLVTQSSTLTAGTVQVKAGEPTQTINVPTLSAGTTYTVKVSGVPGACGGTYTQSIGSFTTQ